VSSTLGFSTARQLARRDSTAPKMPLAQPLSISEDGNPPGFSCVASADGGGGGVTRISVTGELDIATTARLVAALSRPANGTELVILDLRQVTFIDATGLAVILRADSRLRRAHRHLALIPGPGHVQRLFEITRTNRQLDFLSTPDTNIRSSSIDRQTRRRAFH
jgi:anti-sigma B factor antagonist